MLIWRISCKFDTSEVNVKVFEEGVLGLDLVRRYQILQHVVFNGTVSDQAVGGMSHGQKTIL